MKLFPAAFPAAFPVAQICPNSNEIVFSCKRTFLVAQIRQNWYKIAYSRVRAFTVVQIQLGYYKRMHLVLGSRSERGGACRAPTKRVLFKQVKVGFSNYQLRGLTKISLKPEIEEQQRLVKMGK